MLSFQTLDVYRCSIEFLARSVDLPDVLPRGHAALADQLLARGSAMECAAVMDAFLVLRVIEASQHAAAVDLLERIVSMLTKL
jgi:hypothetical protein